MLILPTQEYRYLKTARGPSSFAVFSRFPAGWLLLAAGAVVLRLVFLLYTNRVWEDALITVLHSENVFRGIGLTHFHRDGVPVHGFTSPISVLIPLLGDFLHRGFGLWLIRIISAFAGGAAVLLGMSIARQAHMPSPLTWLVGIYLACEYHQILWGMAGMETELVTAILLFSIWALNGHRPLAVGLAMGLCLLARPDFLMWVVSIWALFLIRNRKTPSWGGIWKLTGILLLVYLPWLAFTTLYYGSPIPNTILAKSAGYALWINSGSSVAYVIANSMMLAVHDLFAPLGLVYGGNGTGFVSLNYHLLEVIATALLAIGVCVGFTRRCRAMLPVSLFLSIYALYYVLLVPNIFGWYCVPVCAVGIVGVAIGLRQLMSQFPASRRLILIGTYAYLGGLIAFLPLEFRSERFLQTLIEDGVRKKQALYLREVSGPNDTIGIEPLGYMSYYSQREIYDYPGLVSPRVVRFLRTHPDRRRMDHVLEALRPDWIVLRRREFEKLFAGSAQNGWLAESYRRTAEFAADPLFRRVIIAPETNIDTDFYVFKKRN